MTGDHRPLKWPRTTPCPHARCLMVLSSRQPSYVLHDENEKGDPTTGTPRDKNWLAKIGAAFGTLGNPFVLVHGGLPFLPEELEMSEPKLLLLSGGDGNASCDILVLELTLDGAQYHPGKQ
jgi:hypothetical protein